MRKIGVTIDGDHIVEMSNEEVRAFTRLSMTAAGKSPWESDMQRPMGSVSLDTDLSTAIDWVTAFAAFQGTLNEAGRMVSDLQAAIKARETRKELL